MPPLAVVEIPVLGLSPASSTPPPKRGNGKAALKSLLGRPEEGEDNKPLSVRLDQQAPRAAHIIAREITDRGALYTLKIGEVEVPQVELDEILQYVSPEHLEEYESQQFVEEEEVQRVAEEAETQRTLAKLERMKERAQMKGVLMRVDSNDDAIDSEASAVAVGKHGRARPSYKAQFKKLKRRRRKRNPVTGELMPLSDEDEDEDPAGLESTSEEEVPEPRSVTLTATGMPEPPKRRRRKRNPVTGELMPLEPLGPSKASFGTPKKLLPLEKKKRPRRRRHPLTGELMPLGWRFEPKNSSDRFATGSAFGAMSPAMQRMSLSQEQSAKRVKLAHQGSESDGEEQGSVTESNADDTDEVTPAVTPASALKAASSPAGGRLGMPLALQQAAAYSTGETSPEPIVERKKSKVTSIMQPTATATSAEQSDQDEDEEWIIEDILSHRMSDPRTHPPDLGTKSVMLYRVKWQGYVDPSWEPKESFSDPSIIDAYHRMLKQRSGAKNANTPQAKVASMTGTVNSLTQGTVGSRAHPMDLTEEDDEEEEDGYEIEAILGHEMSDPRTHASDLGKKAVMLYNVKWKGYQNPTWEPIGSFDDVDVVNHYRSRVGLPVLKNEDLDE